MDSENTNEKVYFSHPSAEIDEGVTIGKNTKIWHFSHVLTNTTIGEECNIGQNVVVGPDVNIGDGCKIQNNVSVYKGVTLEEEVFCGPSMVFTNVYNPRSHIKRMDEIRPTLVKKGASLGANCTIVCGVTIGKYAFVGAGAVVTKDVPDHALVMGNPAIQKGWMCRCGEKTDQDMKCPVCDEQYNNSVTPIAFVDLEKQQKRILPQVEANIRRVLNHGKYIMGPEVKELETELADYVGVRHAISCASGTDALLMILMAYEIGPGDAVFTTPFTFIATAEVIQLLGAKPVFVDIDPDTFNISPENLRNSIDQVLKEGTGVPKAVIPVDLFGLPCDYESINRIAEKQGITVIEDAAQSFGAIYNGEKAGTLTDCAATSFFPAKPLGCYGDGGAVFTNSDSLADKLKSIRVHGKGGNKYDNIRIGINGRLDTIQAAVLLAKLEIFQDEFRKRQDVANQYTSLLSEQQTALQFQKIPNGCTSAWAQYSILAKDEKQRDKVLENLKLNEIPSAIYYPTPLHLQPAFSGLDYQLGDFQNAENCSKRIFGIPMHPYLTLTQQRIVSECVISAMEKTFDE